MRTDIRRPARTMLHSVMFAAFVSAGIAFAATPVLAATWDSIAVDDDTSTAAGNAGYGVGTGGSKAAAEADAMKNCKSEGNKGCQVEISFQSGCGAYASSKQHSGDGTGATKAAASAAAKSNCGDGSCKVVVADCIGDS